MKLKIDDKYIERFFNKKVYVSRWRNNSLILMNESEHSELLKGIRNIENESTRGISRFLEAGVINVDICDGIIEIPKYLSDYTGTEFCLRLTKQGLFLIPEK